MLAYRITFIVSYSLFIATPVLGQKKFARSLTIGSSYTYIFNKTETTSGVMAITHQEFTWNTNIALEVLPRWYLGFMYLNIRSISELNVNRKSQHDLFGVFSQYDFILPNENSRLFGELQYKYGDYCTCGEFDPFALPDLHYLGLGIGAELPIYKRLRLDLAFYNSLILNEVPLKYNFTQYVIGLEL